MNQAPAVTTTESKPRSAKTLRRFQDPVLSTSMSIPPIPIYA
jgi:hypothetical protein